uniref:Cytochrome P450 n=1 Tax=Photinus pyralis TaxID=7054 RepID=A0A1Y1NJR9_PHOPY
MVLVILLAVLLAVVAGLVLYFKNAWSYWQKRGVKVPPVTFPYGHAKSYMTQKKSLHVMYADFYNEHKMKKLKYGGFYFSTLPVLVITDNDLIRRVLVKDFASFTDRPMYVNEEADPLSGMTFNLKGQKWRNVRVKVSEAYTSDNMRMMFETFENHTKKLGELMAQCIRDKRPVDVKDTFARFAMDTIGTAGFGVECNGLSQQDSEFRKYAMKAFQRDLFGVLKDALMRICPGLMFRLKATLIPKDVSDFFIKLVGDVATYRETNKVTKKDLIQLLIELRNRGRNVPGESEMTINEMAAQCFGFFSAGFDTATTAMTFCFFELSRNPHAQETLRAEIREVLKKNDSKITYNAIMQMPYLDQCVSEALRMYPPGGLLVRQCTQTYRLPGTNLTVEKGTQIRIPLLGVHYDPEYYPEPYKFDPERFSPENKAARHPCAWMPFGEGPRNCLGMRFGLMQVKVAVVAMLNQFRFTLNERTKLPITFDPKSLSLKSEHDIFLNVEKC